MTAISQSCRKFAAPHVCQYARNQINSQSSAAHRSQSGIFLSAGSGETIFQPEWTAILKREPSRARYSLQTRMSAYRFIGARLGVQTITANDSSDHLTDQASSGVGIRCSFPAPPSSKVRITPHVAPGPFR